LHAGGSVNNFAIIHRRQSSHNKPFIYLIQYFKMKVTAFITSLAIVGSEAFAPGVGHAQSSTGE